MKIFSLALLLALLISPAVRSETNDSTKIKEAARSYALGQELVSKGEYEKALTSLNIAVNLDPASIAYPYEIALTYFRMKRFAESSRILDSLLNHPLANDKVYQLHINALEFLGKRDRALEVCAEGLNKFPNSGRLYTEKGMLTAAAEKFREAAAFWEKGIVAEPSYPDNYYRLAQYYAYTSEKIWTLIYGEIYMNLSINRPKMNEISKLMYNVYYEALQTRNDSVGMKFTAINYQTLMNLDTNKIPFQLAFQKVMQTAAKQLPPGTPNPEIISALRSNFIKLWGASGLRTRFPNALFERQKSLVENGMFPMYDSWLLRSSKEKDFNEWVKKYQTKFVEFGKWFEKNPLVLNEKNYLSIDRF